MCYKKPHKNISYVRYYKYPNFHRMKDIKIGFDDAAVVVVAAVVMCTVFGKARFQIVVNSGGFLSKYLE